MISNEVAKKVAHWWRDQVENPTPKDAGRPDQDMNPLAALLGNMLANDTHVDSFQCDVFEDVLAKLIVAENETTLDCDYGPSYILGLAAKEAEIDPSRFPWKTYTKIRDDKAYYKLRYNGSITEIV